MNDIYSLEAEQSVLGSILIDAAGAIPKVIDGITADDFYLAPHKLIYTSMLDMYATAQAVDFVTLSEKLADADLGMEPKKYLITLSEMVPSIANVTAYAQIVAKSARARKLQTVIASLQDGGLTADNVDEMLEEVSGKLYDIGQSRSTQKKGLSSIRELLLEYLDKLNKKTELETVDTGFSDLDVLLKGLPKTDMVIIAARPGVGKSALAQQIAENVASKTHQAVNIYSQEMAKLQIVERMIAHESKIEMDKLIDKDIQTEDWINIAPAADLLSKLDIYISDDASITVPIILSQCRMTKNLGLVIVDYLQLMKASKHLQNREQEVAQISRELKLLAMSLNVPVVALSQLNRAVEGRGDKEPNLSDLRESGAIEQDASKVILGWVVDEEKSIVGWAVKKNRRGKMGKVQFKWDGPHMTFYPLVKEDYISTARRSSRRTDKYRERED